ncbi:MAG: discoidin domain-containing protein [Xanthobacteraceae bacterium]|jgi:hypothetical protein|nr:discoidin domain-containing protein [Xanthobacteraceae bacterium]
MSLRLVLTLLAASAFAAVASAQPKPKEECATQNGQFAETRFCVSSALAPQGENKYGPEIFVEGDEKKAWCEGVVGYGIGESVTIHFKPAVRMQEFTFVNGYQKSDETYKNNSRVKQLRIQTSDGFANVVTVPDTKDGHTVKLPRPVKPQWVRFTIAEVYPGARGSDTCISGIFPNLEQLNN